MEKLTNDEIIERVNAWQNAGFIHPLTCINSNHPKLIAVEENGVVVLKCTKCKYEQGKIPPSVLEITPELINENKKQLEKQGFKF